jgi:hypothetical protein
MTAKQTTLVKLTFGSIVDYRTARGFKSILMLDSRGYHLRGCDYGRYGFPARKEAIAHILAFAPTESVVR